MGNSKGLALFKKGIMDGVPIGLGYLPLGIALGISAQKCGLALWIWSLMSGLLISGSAQAAVLNLFASGEVAIIAYVVTFFIVNSRYLLLSLSMVQRLDPNMSTLERLVFGFFNTDEIYAVAMRQPGKIKASYLFGIAIPPFASYMIAIVVGFLATELMPASVSSAFGITLYAMFLALVVPPMRGSRPVTVVVLCAVALNLICEAIPQIKATLTPGYTMMICAVVTAVIGACMYPLEKSENGE
ncbi:MAG: AzlC family ABC transporter permease [Oscillospiraceae bacterium]|nr:AzlC family ABC transporter permease [Oscillospiraceae bacterium]